MNQPPSSSGDALYTLQIALRQFAAERDWDQYHSPKNLAIAVSVEAGELLELFQWLREDGAHSLSPEQIARIREEMADVLLYLIRLADRLNVDLLVAARDKLELNTQKYPVDKARGSSRKYTEF